MSDVKVAYNGQEKFRDNWEDVFRGEKRRLNLIEKQWEQMPIASQDGGNYVSDSDSC